MYFIILILHLDSASKGNKYQDYFLADKGGRYVVLANLPPSCAECLEFWEPQPAGALRACPGLQWVCFASLILHHPWTVFGGVFA